MSEEAKKARRRALRAARVATLGLALAGGCYAEHGTEPEPEVAFDAAVVTADAETPSFDGGPVTLDAGTPDLGQDAGATVADAGPAVADAGACAPDMSWGDCCNHLGWPCDLDSENPDDWGCCAWGPYVPPGEGALPPSRVRV